MLSPAPSSGCGSAPCHLLYLCADFEMGDQEVDIFLANLLTSILCYIPILFYFMPLFYAICP